jgi:hypothetical protein
MGRRFRKLLCTLGKVKLIENGATIGRIKEQDTNKFWTTTNLKKIYKLKIIVFVGMKRRDKNLFCNDLFRTEIMEIFLLCIMILFSPLLNTQEYFS